MRKLIQYATVSLVFLIAAPAPMWADRLRVMFLGNTTLVFDDGQSRVLTDGFLTRPGFGKYALGVRVKTDPERVDAALEAAQLTQADGIFVAHAHFDHVMDVGYVATSLNARVYGSRSTRAVALAGGVEDQNIEVLHDERTYAVGSFRVTAIYAPHSDPNRFPGELRRGFMPPQRLRDFLDNENYSFLFRSGDQSALVVPGGNYLEGKLSKYSAQTVFLGIGGLSMIARRAADRGDPDFIETYWAETVTAVGAKTVVPIHWDNFFEKLEPGQPFKTPPRFVENLPYVKQRLEALATRDGVQICWLDTPFKSIDLTRQTVCPN